MKNFTETKMKTKNIIQIIPFSGHYMMYKSDLDPGEILFIPTVALICLSDGENDESVAFQVVDAFDVEEEHFVMLDEGQFDKPGVIGVDMNGVKYKEYFNQK